MAQVITRLNLASAAFPFLSEFSGRGIIVKQSDQNYIPTVTSKEDLDKDVGIPQVYYCHNIIATGQGYQAVSYIDQISGPADAPFLGIIPIIDDLGNKIYLAWNALGKVYVSPSPNFNYYIYVQTISAIATKEVTYCVVNGVTYVYIAQTGCYTFDFYTTYTLVSKTLTGITTSAVLGIFACQGYMLVYSTNSVLWSSLADPTDFTPSLTTGAGGGQVQNIRGDIVCCVAHTIGFVVYTNQNAVSATSSGNSRYPFNFRELVASGGLFSKDLVTYDSNTGSHYSYTTSGLQLISLQQAQTTIPEVTDFLAGSVMETYDEQESKFVVTHLTTPMKKKLVLIADRYLVISYGISSLSHALIYDTIMKKWSKLKIDHVCCFEFALLQAETATESPRRSMAFLGADGSVKLLKIDTRDSNANGVFLLGKIQYIRQRVTTLLSADIENIESDATLTVQDLYTLDGKTPMVKAGYHMPSSISGAQVRKYLFNSVGVNHSLLLKGRFNLTSIVVATAVHGRR